MIVIVNYAGGSNINVHPISEDLDCFAVDVQNANGDITMTITLRRDELLRLIVKAEVALVRNTIIANVTPPH